MSDPDELAAAARSACSHAYAPYSHFHVGAAILTTTGAIYAGCNVENASYPLGVCAERNAVAVAVAGEGPGMRIAEVVIATGDDFTAAPCGGCRQVMREFGDADTPVTLLGDDGPTTYTLDQLLPHAFVPSDLLERPGS